jgi:hypothetical protein
VLVGFTSISMLCSFLASVSLSRLCFLRDDSCFFEASPLLAGSLCSRMKSSPCFPSSHTYEKKNPAGREMHSC